MTPSQISPASFCRRWEKKKGREIRGLSGTRLPSSVSLDYLGVVLGGVVLGAVGVLGVVAAGLGAAGAGTPDWAL